MADKNMNNGYRFEVVRNYNTLEGPFKIREIGTQNAGHHYISARDVASFVITGISHGFMPKGTNASYQKFAERIRIKYDEVRIDSEVHKMPEFKDGKTISKRDKKTKETSESFIPGYYEVIGRYLTSQFDYNERPLEEYEAHQRELKGLEGKVAAAR